MCREAYQQKVAGSAVLGNERRTERRICCFDTKNKIFRLCLATLKECLPRKINLKFALIYNIEQACENSKVCKLSAMLSYNL